MKAFRRRYWSFLLTVVGLGVFFLLGAERGARAMSVTAYSMREMLLVIPPVFLLLGLLDVWVPRDVMVRYMANFPHFADMISGRVVRVGFDRVLVRVGGGGESASGGR